MLHFTHVLKLKRRLLHTQQNTKILYFNKSVRKVFEMKPSISLVTVHTHTQTHNLVAICRLHNPDEAFLV